MEESGPRVTAPTTVTPLATPDYLAEARAILADERGALVVRREHLMALQSAIAETAKNAALMNRALVGVMCDSKQPQLCIPAGLVQAIERNQLDLAIEFTRGTIIVTLLKPTPAGKVN